MAEGGHTGAPDGLQAPTTYRHHRETAVVILEPDSTRLTQGTV
jgi:hypothetical protein